MSCNVLNRALALACMLVLCVSVSSVAGTLVSETEDIGARGPTTRVFKRVYEFENPAGETFTKTRKVVEKADGLCYDASLNTNEAVTPPPVGTYR